MVISFVVEPDGTISGVNAAQSPSELLSAEAIRVVKSSSKWEPVYKDGRDAVRVRHNLPITFVLQ